jgi:hypothetical protein
VKSDAYGPRSISSLQNDANGVYSPKPLSPPDTPTAATHNERGATSQNGRPKTSFEDTEKEKEKDKSAGKKVQKMLRNRVHKEQRRISTIGRKIGHGVGRQRGGLTLRRTTSTPSKEGALCLYLTDAYLGFFFLLMQATCTRYWESTKPRTKPRTRPLPSTPVGTALTLPLTTSSVPNRRLHYLPRH